MGFDQHSQKSEKNHKMHKITHTHAHTYRLKDTLVHSTARTAVKGREEHMMAEKELG